MQNAADHPAVIHPCLASHIRRQMRFDLAPLLIAQPKQIASHPNASRITKQWNHQPIQPTTFLLSTGPSKVLATYCGGNAKSRKSNITQKVLSFCW
jgi:hypothetical protein